MISLVFPAYNPGPVAADTFAAGLAFVRSRPDPWEVIFVLDGCTDDTPARLDDLCRAAADPRVRVIGYGPNRGKGYAVRAGLLAARGDYRIFTDIDLAYSLADVARVADELRAGADVAIASRDHPDSRVQLPVRMIGAAYRRRVQSRVFGAAARLLLPLAQRDTQAGLKGMTAAVARHVLPALRCDGFGFDCEFLTACRKSGVPVAEIPVCVRYDDGATTTGRGVVLAMLRELWRIRRDWAGRSIPPFVRPADAEPARRAA